MTVRRASEHHGAERRTRAFDLRGDELAIEYPGVPRQKDEKSGLARPLGQ